MRRIAWVGSSKADLMAFPDDARREAGYQLDKVQRGEDPDDWKPMKTIGSGVREIRIHEACGTFRLIYVVLIGECIHVLHCFQKKAQRTSRHDLALAKHRFSRIKG
ncbi:MAG: type II toxin-antitoxin system RelE/ParE family toxin [Nitrococcus sp.]|nr:type II toxin-antitoxin system RelE/ParE family toxin [Nitrococcus sp.]